MVLEVSGRDRASVQQNAGHVQADQRHGPGGNPLIATHQGDHGVKHVAATHQLHGVSDHFAADEGCLHALGAHGHPVRNGDRVELHGRASRGAHAFLHLGG